MGKRVRFFFTMFSSGGGHQVARPCGGFALKICLESHQQMWRDGDGEACGWVENRVKFWEMMISRRRRLFCPHCHPRSAYISSLELSHDSLAMLGYSFAKNSSSQFYRAAEELASTYFTTLRHREMWPNPRLAVYTVCPKAAVITMCSSWRNLITLQHR